MGAGTVPSKEGSANYVPNNFEKSWLIPGNAAAPHGDVVKVSMSKDELASD